MENANQTDGFPTDHDLSTSSREVGWIWNQAIIQSIKQLIHQINNLSFIASNETKTIHTSSSYFITVNTLWPEQNDWHFEDDIFKWIFSNKNYFTMLWISMNFIPSGPIGSKLTLVIGMVWYQAINWTNTNQDKPNWRHMISLGQYISEYFSKLKFKKQVHFTHHLRPSGSTHPSC